MKHRPLSLLAAVALAAVTLSGCASAPAQAINAEQFAGFVAELESFDGVSEDLVTTLATGVCEVCEAAEKDCTDQQTALQMLLKEYTSQGLDAGDVGAFFTYVTARHCPEYVEEGIGG